MKYPFPLNVLAASAAIAALASPLAHAQAEAGQSITITAARQPLAVSQALAEVTVLDAQALQRSEARTLAELLAQQAGLQLSSNGGLGKTSSLFIRGLEARHTLLLVDGVRVGSATVGTPSLDNLPLEAVERIEIVRGPMSSLYGSGAMGGVIQVITRRGGQGLSGNAKLAAGSQAYGQAAAGLGFGDGRFDAALQLQHTQTDGQSASNPRVPFGQYNDDRDGWKQDGGSLRLGWRVAGDWRLEALALAARGRTQLDDGPGADARAELTTQSTVLSARGTVLGPWSTRVSLGESVDGYETLSSASPFASLGLIRTRSRQLAWENTVATPLGTALALAERTTETVSRPGQPFATSERDIDAVALGLAGSAAGHTWQASLRRDRNSQFGGVSTGALGWGYAITPGWRIGASAGTSLNAPSFNQLYFPNFGNPLLLPEKGEHAEMHVRWLWGMHSLRASTWAHEYRGFITSGPQPVNLPLARINGVSLAYEGAWDSWRWQAAAEHTDPRNATEGSANRDKLLPRRAQNALRLGADWTQGAFSAGGSLVAFSHRFDNAANTVRLAGYATLDLRADWALQPGLSLGLRVNNVGDTGYETALGYDQPGRQAFVTLRAQWK